MAGTFQIVVIFFHSSEDESCTVSGGVRGKCNADLSSEDEFEKEMDSEAMATLRLMVSPTAAAQAAKGHVIRATPSVSGTTTSKRQRGEANRDLARARQQRSSTDQQRKMVRFSEDVKTDDMEEGTNTGLIGLIIKFGRVGGANLDPPCCSIHV